jgi:hypothetical protein
LFNQRVGWTGFERVCEDERAFSEALEAVIGTRQLDAYEGVPVLTLPDILEFFLKSFPILSNGTVTVSLRGFVG